MHPTVDAGDIAARRFAPITETDTTRTPYERVHNESIQLFENQLPNITNDTITDQRTPQDEYDGKRYYHTKDSSHDLKHIPHELLTDPDRQTELYDRIRALDFPPHEPAYTHLHDEQVYLTKNGIEHAAE